MAILTELRDPRVQNVTVTGVKVAPDLKSAKVLVSIMGDARAQQLTLKGLQNSAGFLQKRIADRIEMRWTPRLSFEIDEGVKRSLEVARILNDVLPGRPDEDEDDDPDGEAAAWAEGDDVLAGDGPPPAARDDDPDEADDPAAD